MRQLVIRLDDDLYEETRRLAYLSRTSMAAIGREALAEMVRTLGASYSRASENLKKLEAVAQRRSSPGPRSKEEAHRMASEAAHLDDSEGLGEITVHWGDRAGRRKKL